jgi:hypothetical protein
MTDSPFLERLAILAGSTTFRPPLEGVGTKVHHIPQAHCLLITLCGARGTPWSPGPELAFSLATGIQHKRDRVVDWLETVLCFGDPSATDRKKAREIAETAYDCMVLSKAAPTDGPLRQRKAIGFAVALLSQSLDETVRRAERGMAMAG